MSNIKTNALCRDNTQNNNSVRSEKAFRIKKALRSLCRKQCFRYWYLSNERGSKTKNPCRKGPILCLPLVFVFPSVPAVFCDYYNPPDKHEWFYKPCGAPCLKTCRNPQGKCGNILYSLEGNSSLTLMQFVEDLSDFKCLKQQDCCLTLEEYLICPRNSLTVPCLRLILCAVVPFEAEFARYF